MDDQPVKVNKLSANPYISSGVTELDAKMGGGLPIGALTLIEGPSGSGKSVLSQQMIYGALNNGGRVVLFTSENTVKSLIHQMGSMNLDVLDFLLLRRLRIFPIRLSQIQGDATNTLLDAMMQYARRDDRGKPLYDMIIVDSLSSAIGRDSTDGHVMHYFEGCKTLAAIGVTIMNVMHPGKLPDDLMNIIRSMSDAHLRLHSEQDGQRIVKAIEIAKIRGAGGVTGAIVGFDVDPDWGMRVIPISKARG